MPPMIEFPLDLPEVRVLKTELKKREIVITVESTRPYAICSRCGQKTFEFHSYDDPIRLRHLPILEQRVFIELRPKRFRCPTCDDHPTTTQQCDWYEPRSPHTKAFDQSLLRQLINSTVSDVARKQQVSYDSVLGAINRGVERSVNWSVFSKLKVIGMDEIALRKGHRDFVVIVTSLGTDEEIALLGVLPDRKKETVVAFLRSIPPELRASIERVCADMYEGYTNAVKEEVAQARVVIDRFHVAKAYRECADKLRKSALRELKQGLEKEEYKLLKGTMWPFRRNAADLDPEQREAVDLLLECAPDLRKAYKLREELSAIFDTEQSKESATRAITRWIGQVKRSGLKCFDSFLTTLDNWLDEITNYFLDRQTSGFQEGFNNKIKVLKRRCYGITNISHLFQRIWLDLEGFKLFGS
jgi:transposase